MFPLCNNRPERAPHICGHTFLLCWRCTGILTGIVLIDMLYLTFNINPNIFIPLSIFVLPLAIDGYRQYFMNLMSNNPRRFCTGFLCGIAIMGWATIVKEGVILWIK
jgi:uncharacterized membrane protein